MRTRVETDTPFPSIEKLGTAVYHIVDEDDNFIVDELGNHIISDKMFIAQSNSSVGREKPVTRVRRRTPISPRKPIRH